MSRAEDLFFRLEGGGYEALTRLIEDREAESLFLDFKRSPRDGEGERLHDDDSKNLSKAISGFGNSEGGVLIWGVDCRRNAQGIETASKHPLLDVSGFRTKIENAISRLSIPPHALVRALEIFELDGRSGYLAVLIPKGRHGPIRSNSTNHYHLRAGANFEIVPHDALAGMFGKSPIPRVRENQIMRFARMDERREVFNVSVGVALANTGSVLADRPYLSIWLNELPPQYVHAVVPAGAPYDLRRGNLPGIAVVGRPGTALPPYAADDVCDLVFHFPRGFRGDVSLQCTVGCQGAEPSTFFIRSSGDTLGRLIARALLNEALSAADVFEIDVPGA